MRPSKLVAAARLRGPEAGLAGAWLVMCALGVSACGEDEVARSGSVGAAGGASGAGSGATSGAGGSAGQSSGGSAGQSSGGSAGLSDERGDPSTFPTECTDSCEAACARLDECGGSSSAYPVSRESCVALCGLAKGGPLWDDVSGNFRCCTEQASCGDVRNCGGFLKHKDPAGACKQLCKCLLGGSDLPAPTAPPTPVGAEPPAGYRFSTDSVVVSKLREASSPGSQVAGQPATGQGALPGATRLFGGQYGAYRLPFQLTRSRLAELQLAALPTFVDAAGRLAGGTAGMSIQLTDPEQLQHASDIAQRFGLSTPEPVKYGKHLYYLRGTDPWLTLEALHALVAVPGVSAEIDMVRQHQATYQPLDPLYARQWHLENRGERDSVRGVDARVSEAWDLTFGDPDVIVAINDDGVAIGHNDLSFDSLAPLNYPAGWEDRLKIGAFGGHGTSVAGVAAAHGDNGYGGAGVCPDCKILPHWFGEFGASGGVTDKDIADGFTSTVDAGAWVINNSWGASGGDPRFALSNFGVGAIPQLVRAAFDYAETDGRGGKGTVVLFAAGNSNEIVNDYGAYDSVLAVAAVDDQGLKSYYSNFGAAVDIAAPSNGGLNGITTTAAPAGYTHSFGGTSSACPFASGVAGLILSANPELTAAEVRDIMRASATKIDPVWGEWKHGVSPFYGSGLLNAYVAVQMARGACVDPSTCQAPSDACGSSCDNTQCGECRTDANCAAGYRCQALPALGRQVCVQMADQGSCPAGSDLEGEYCVPQPATCGVCEAEERCNGRDDDCDGAIDEDAACDSQLCVQAGEGCGEASRCAGINCTGACANEMACEEGESCDPVKSRYGKSTPIARGCNPDLSAGCPAGCEMLASTLSDPDLQGFVECMEDGSAACSKAQACAIKLPVTF